MRLVNRNSGWRTTIPQNDMSCGSIDKRSGAEKVTINARRTYPRSQQCGQRLLAGGSPSLYVGHCDTRGETQRDILHGSAAKRTEADRRTFGENLKETARTRADLNPDTALWTTLSGFESLPPSHEIPSTATTYKALRSIRFDWCSAPSYLVRHHLASTY
jgi:hypothetical protein